MSAKIDSATFAFINYEIEASLLGHVDVNEGVCTSCRNFHIHYYFYMRTSGIQIFASSQMSIHSVICFSFWKVSSGGSKDSI